MHRLLSTRRRAQQQHLLLEKMLEFSCSQSAIARGVHFIKYQFVLSQLDRQHVPIFILQDKAWFEQQTTKEQYTCHSQDSGEPTI